MDRERLLKAALAKGISEEEFDEKYAEYEMEKARGNKPCVICGTYKNTRKTYGNVYCYGHRNRYKAFAARMEWYGPVQKGPRSIK